MRPRLFTASVGCGCMAPSNRACSFRLPDPWSPLPSQETEHGRREQVELSGEQRRRGWTLQLDVPPEETASFLLLGLK